MKSEKLAKIPTLELVLDYKAIQNLEAEYFKLCQKYDPDSTYESDPVCVEILLELGQRAVGEYK